MQSWLMRIVGALLVVWFGLAPGGVVASDRPTSPTLATYKISALGGMQMEVWLAGRRVGFTPVEVMLPQGALRVTASGESLVPFVGVLNSTGSGEVTYTIPAAPLTIENYEAVSQDFTRVIVREGDNPHLVIMGLHMMTNPDEGVLLLAKADQMIPGDPVVDALRAKVLIRQGKPAEALVASQRAVQRLPRVGFVWRVYAEALEANGDYQGALTALNQAMLHEPQGWRSLRVRSRVNQVLGNDRAAALDEERAQELYEALHRMIERAAAEQRQRRQARSAPR